MEYTTYQQLLDGVAQYYGQGSDQWVQIAQYGVTEQTIPILRQVPGVDITVSNSGKFLGWDYNNPFASTTNPASVIDSNVQSGAYGAGSFNAQLPATAVTNPSTGVTTMQSGAKVASTGATLATIADRTFLAVAGVSLGTKLGKLIDSGLYAADPEWWDEHYPTINPETWDDMASTEGGKSFIRSIFGLQNDDTTMYLDERMLAYTYMTLLANGAYNEQSAVYPPADTSPQFNPDANYFSPINVSSSVSVSRNGQTMTATATGATAVVFYNGTQPNNIVWPYFVSETPFTISGSLSGSSHSVTHNGITYHVNHSNYYQNRKNPTIPITPATLIDGVHVPTDGRANDDVLWDYAYRIFNGEQRSGLPGVNDNQQAGQHITPNTLINPTTGSPVTPNDDPADVLQALRNQYPDLFDGEIYEDVPQPDGTTDRIRYIPVPYPDTTNKAEPTTDTTPGVDPQTQPQVNPETRPQTQIDDLVDTLTSDPTPPDTGDGDTPPAVIPTGTANALYSIYNPSQSELNSFGAWLWSSNFVDQLLKVFNDPMQAIIGLHKVFAQPGISGTSTIHVGYLDSEVSSNVVGNQYTTVDCGSVNVSEYFGNVFDYDPFTQIYIYLPFIGIEKLDTGDVMRGRIGVTYHVDVLTGACLAEIKVTRDGSGGILYTYAGNCAVQYPISSGSYMGIVASMASIAGGVVGTIASGGALAPVAMGAVSGALNAHTRVQHSGGFSGNAGAMGVKKPYLIITRPQTALADNFPAFDGYPANKRTTISACSGFVKCETCHIENVPATDAELNEIETLLKEGIII